MSTAGLFNNVMLLTMILGATVLGLTFVYIYISEAKKLKQPKQKS